MTLRRPPRPQLSDEEHDWAVNPHAVVPRRTRLDHTGPYRSAVAPEVARSDAELGPEVAPFAALLLRSESAASSRIENLTASARAIALAELGDPSRRNANVIVANTRAMQAAIELADRLDEQAILDMHAALLGASNPEMVGHWRAEQVWIGGSSSGPHPAGSAQVAASADRRSVSSSRNR